MLVFVGERAGRAEVRDAVVGRLGGGRRGGPARGVRWIGRRRPGTVVRTQSASTTPPRLLRECFYGRLRRSRGEGHRPRRAPDPPPRWPVAPPGGWRSPSRPGTRSNGGCACEPGRWSRSPCGRVRTTGAGRPSGVRHPRWCWSPDGASTPTGPAVPPCAARAFGVGSAGITVTAKAPDVAGAARTAFTLRVSVVPYAKEG